MMVQILNNHDINCQFLNYEQMIKSFSPEKILISYDRVFFKKLFDLNLN